ncbi:cytochrome b5 reductase 4 isoform X2 [Bombus impatiens]|uniref:Cytochrome b5 reductase 4 isoform X2 n=1 Tax=Bombus impatiens TaxID=132113 RepID=A0A6P6FGW4_BOMIM|nr:cytochrome b5 reductase 4 isoform X2 [Bombus impatiens]XP_012247299.1 cytochrome b5 reductase 4 isoform X2 [Bombus impatiens]XP_012247314.1 cytochrome b5 reductase 4 isoform X2 [Bombus impatiens]XP_012247317.1 cytochrome b5 reductase 4 isoform X2 [Bombus impatiens]XP_024227146.1 cytochrome b5 reductase 4 isoform X2 [Bombus impatiens]XP_024227150.1 cytochrome b5 reductase 4 isoform X2 [Bombus impatiens]XP_033179755.1 cytochrome b5 reductase 4 isoform X2 [Bombus impatiens]XP_033179772.1 cyt
MPRCCGASLVSVMGGEGSPQSLGLQIQDGNPRNKTALAPGHSLMDWIRLGNSGVDLTGVGGVPRVVTLSELATHNKQNDAWIAIRGIVFNVTRYMDFHPGGVNELMRGVGKDATKLFENVHAWVNYQSILQKCVVGRLSRGSVSGTTASSPTENAASSTSNCSSATLNLITSCTTHSVNQENVSDANLLNIKMEWRQTPITFILFYPTPRNYPNMCYQLTRINDSKLAYKLCFGSNVVIQELELTGEVEWPPVCFRDLEMREMTFTFTKRKVELWKSYGTQTVLRETNMDNRMYTEYEVLANILLSKLVHLLVVRAKDFLQIIPIGRHVEVKMNVMGTEVSRLYTPVPPCLHPDDMAPNYKSDCLCFMIKKYPSGALSPSITALQIGQTFLVSNALGDFMTEPYDIYTMYHLIAGGTGLTVLLGIIQQALARTCVRSINLLNFNKDEDNMFYAKELEKASTDGRLKVTHILSQAADTWKGRRGSLSDYLLEELIGTGKNNAFVYTCGPAGFIQSAKNLLRKLNWKPCQTHEFED